MTRGATSLLHFTEVGAGVQHVADPDPNLSDIPFLSAKWGGKCSFQEALEDFVIACKPLKW